MISHLLSLGATCVLEGGWRGPCRHFAHNLWMFWWLQCGPQAGGVRCTDAGRSRQLAPVTAAALGPFPAQTAAPRGGSWATAGYNVSSCKALIKAFCWLPELSVIPSQPQNAPPEVGSGKKPAALQVAERMPRSLWHQPSHPSTSWTADAG